MGASPFWIGRFLYRLHVLNDNCPYGMHPLSLSYPSFTFIEYNGLPTPDPLNWSLDAMGIWTPWWVKEQLIEMNILNEYTVYCLSYTIPWSLLLVYSTMDMNPSITQIKLKIRLFWRWLQQRRRQRRRQRRQYPHIVIVAFLSTTLHPFSICIASSSSPPHT